jgi:hypothetical protein
MLTRPEAAPCRRPAETHRPPEGTAHQDGLAAQLFERGEYLWDGVDGLSLADATCDDKGKTSGKHDGQHPKGDLPHTNMTHY